MDEIQVFTMRRSERCLACAFTVDALVDAIEDNAFTLCRDHMTRAAVRMSERSGEPHLAPVPG